jgi:flagellar biosynthetic protein FliR
MTPVLAVYVGLVLARVGAFVAVLPPFAGRTPRTVRAALAVALTAFYVGGAAPTWDAAFAHGAADVHPVTYGVALLREALLGAAMGFAFGLFLLPARAAGEFLTQQIGLPGTPQLGPAGELSTGPLAATFETVSVLAFLAVDGHHVLLGALHASFDRFPLGGSVLPGVAPMVNGLQSAHELGLVLAGPLAVCLFLLAIALAVTARAVPQLNVYSVGFTLQVLVGLVGGLVLMPDFVKLLVSGFARGEGSLERILGG